jgi:DNA primase
MAGLTTFFTSAEVAIYYKARIPELKRRGSQWRGPCPIHQGKNDSFAVDPATGLWFCHSKCGYGGDILTLEMALSCTNFRTAKAEVFRLIGRIEPEYRHKRRSHRLGGYRG